VSGTNTDGIYEGTLVIPEGSELEPGKPECASSTSKDTKPHSKRQNSKPAGSPTASKSKIASIQMPEPIRLP